MNSGSNVMIFNTLGKEKVAGIGHKFWETTLSVKKKEQHDFAAFVSAYYYSEWIKKILFF